MLTQNKYLQTSLHYLGEFGIFGEFDLYSHTH